MRKNIIDPIILIRYTTIAIIVAVLALLLIHQRLQTKLLGYQLSYARAQLKNALERNRVLLSRLSSLNTPQHLSLQAERWRIPLRGYHHRPITPLTHLRR